MYSPLSLCVNRFFLIVPSLKIPLFLLNNEKLDSIKPKNVIINLATQKIVK